MRYLTHYHTDESGTTDRELTVRIGYSLRKPDHGRHGEPGSWSPPDPGGIDLDDAVVTAVDGEKPSDPQRENEAFDLLLSTDRYLRERIELEIAEREDERDEQ